MASAADSKLYRERLAQRRLEAGETTRGTHRKREYKREYKPFIGCDGEGGGTDAEGRQNFLLLRIGDRELETGEHLSSAECLEFICQSPADVILVGFYFGYDTTMILRDLDKARLKRLFDPWEKPDETIKTPVNEQTRRMRWTYYKNYGIKYLPRQYLSVCRLDLLGMPIEGTTRTIYETGGFFQGKFAKIIKDFAIPTDEEQKLIEKMKEQRHDFTVITPIIREYNRLECDLLARLMEVFRDCCKAATLKSEGDKAKDLVPRTWNGAGKLATRLHAVFGTITSAEVKKIVPKHCLQMAHEAYYGGRFEVTQIGLIPGPINEYDISSAYPDAMQFLPCLYHGKWLPFGDKGPSNKGSLYLASVYFTHGEPMSLYGMPIRDPSGTIYWPRSGNGTYWSVELESAKALGCKWQFKEGYEYVKTCKCHSFPWVNDLFVYRRSIGKSAKGYPIKLGLNSLYGKFAQRIGNPRYGNFLYASLITARTRARINQAIASDPDSVVMIATDGVYSTRPLVLDEGTSLGQWEHQTFESIFIVKPGLYWTPEKLKTRGVAKEDIEKNRQRFETEWQNFAVSSLRRKDGAFSAPIIPVKTKLFVGLKLAFARGKPETAGTWTGQRPGDKARNISFDWHQKRQPVPLWKGLIAVTIPYPGSAELNSMIYSDVAEKTLEADMQREEYEDMPDSVDTISMMLGEETLR